MTPNPRMTFGVAADRWLSEQVAGLRERTRDTYSAHVENHLRPRFGNWRLDAVTRGEAAKLVRDLQAKGYAEWTIATILKVLSGVYSFAAQELDWNGRNPVEVLSKAERPKLNGTARRIFQEDELARTLAAANEPFGHCSRSRP